MRSRRLIGCGSSEGVHIHGSRCWHGQCASCVGQHKIHDLLPVGDWKILLLHEPVNPGAFLLVWKGWP